LVKGIIGVGLIGYGLAGRVFHAPLISAISGLMLRGIVTADPARGAEAAAAYPDAAIHADVTAMLGDDAVDVVVVASPGPSHAPLAIQALRSGKHVVVDKPFALSLAEAEAVVAVASAMERRVLVFQNRRWDSDFLTLRKALAEGLVGDVVHFESHLDRFRPDVVARWREDGSAGSGIWVDLGPHLVDQALALFGMPLAVSGDLAALRPGAISDDWAHVVLHYADKRVILHASVCVAGGPPRFIVHGTRGSLVKQLPDGQEPQLVAGIRPGDAEWGVDNDPLQCWDADQRITQRRAERGGQEAFYAAVAAMVLDNAAPPNTVAAMLAVQRIVDAAAISSREGRVVIF
jgi:predicted dehydrogenase